MSLLAPVTVHSRLAGQSAELLVKGPVTSNLSWLQVGVEPTNPIQFTSIYYVDWIYRIYEVHQRDMTGVTVASGPGNHISPGLFCSNPSPRGFHNFDLYRNGFPTNLMCNTTRPYCPVPLHLVIFLDL